MYKKLLIPTDGSALADVAALAGVRRARDEGASVIGFAVLPVPRRGVTDAALEPMRRDDGEARAMRERMVFRKLRALADAAAAAGVPYKGLCVISDEPAVEIVDAASRNACDLIFMGSHGRSGLSRIVHGSVAAAVLARSEVPVEIYRPTPEEVVRHANGLDGMAMHKAFG